MVKEGQWTKRGATGRVSKEQQREADKMVAGIIYRSLKNQDREARKKEQIGGEKPMFNFS
jgi:hypothetical protein